MGTLIAWKYRTTLFAKLADHTYVTCGNGAVGWGCWGGKTGGNRFNAGTGSTKRANAIAEPNERAGITCYLVNGVCHQAANRILFPARKTVRGARFQTDVANELTVQEYRSLLGLEPGETVVLGDPEIALHAYEDPAPI